LKVVQFLALVLTALALVPAGAHLFALPNKINLVAEQYFNVQNIYRGWSLFGIVLAGALVANLALAVLLRGRGRPFVLALIADFTALPAGLWMIRRKDAAFHLEDVGSLNGTFVNRHRVESAPLSSGDEIQIGKFKLVFFTGGPPRA